MPKRTGLNREIAKTAAIGQPTFSLLYHLADATENEEYYEEAWKTSNCTFPKAQRRLADLKRLRNCFAEAIPHYELALVLSPNYFPVFMFESVLVRLMCMVLRF